MKFSNVPESTTNNDDNVDPSDYLTNMLNRPNVDESDDAKRQGKKVNKVPEYLQIKSELAREVHEKIIKCADQPRKVLPRATIVLESIANEMDKPTSPVFESTAPLRSNHGKVLKSGRGGYVSGPPRSRSSRNAPSDNSSSQQTTSTSMRNQTRQTGKKEVVNESLSREEHLNVHSVPLQPPMFDNYR